MIKLLKKSQKRLEGRSRGQTRSEQLLDDGNLTFGRELSQTLVLRRLVADRITTPGAERLQDNHRGHLLGQSEELTEESTLSIDEVLAFLGSGKGTLTLQIIGHRAGNEKVFDVSRVTGLVVRIQKEENNPSNGWFEGGLIVPVDCIGLEIVTKLEDWKDVREEA